MNNNNNAPDLLRGQVKLFYTKEKKYIILCQYCVDEYYFRSMNEYIEHSIQKHRSGINLLENALIDTTTSMECDCLKNKPDDCNSLVINSLTKKYEIHCRFCEGHLKFDNVEDYLTHSLSEHGELQMGTRESITTETNECVKNDSLGTTTSIETAIIINNESLIPRESNLNITDMDSKYIYVDSITSTDTPTQFFEDSKYLDEFTLQLLSPEPIAVTEKTSVDECRINEGRVSNENLVNSVSGSKSEKRTIGFDEVTKEFFSIRSLYDILTENSIKTEPKSENSFEIAKSSSVHEATCESTTAINIGEQSISPEAAATVRNILKAPPSKEYVKVQNWLTDIKNIDYDDVDGNETNSSYTIDVQQISSMPENCLNVPMDVVAVDVPNQPALLDLSEKTQCPVNESVLSTFDNDSEMLDTASVNTREQPKLTRSKIFKSQSGKPKNVSCEKCSKKLARQQDLILHMRRYHPLLSCIRCAFNFSGAEELLRHIKQEHSKDQKCPLCDDDVAPDWLNGRHLSTHFYILHCKKCTFCTTDQSVLKTHRTKCGQKTCDLCGEAVRDGTDYRRHCLRFHGIAEPFRCQKCGEAFRHERTRNTHESKCTA